jgi:hypothetical protein
LEGHGIGCHADEVQETSRHVAQFRGKRANAERSRDEWGKGAGVGSEMERRLEQHQSLDPLGVKRAKDRRQCSANRMGFVTLTSFTCSYCLPG